jgi:RimJ/RimL family protein N-acetyltransferase
LGRNVVLETRHKVLDFAFYRLRCHKVYGTVMARNVPAIFNYKALGFRCEGVLKDHDISMLGERTDILMFGMLRSEWDEIREEKQL